MNKSAILHIPMSQYAYGTDENHVTIRIRTKRDDIKKCTLYYGDRSCRLTPVIFTSQEMHIVAQSELFDYFETELVNPYKRLNYYFELNDGTEQILYYGDTFNKETVIDRSEYFQLPFNHRADIVKVPDWAQDTVIYNIFPDSFATGKRYISLKESEKEFNGQITRGKLGGTIKGITENVDYIKELGISAIYINPIFAAGEYHKYDLIDYYHIDPCFGTNEEFKELVEEFHENGLKVIIDGVFNHCGWMFFAFDDVVKNGEKSRYKDWFYGLQFPVIRPDDWETYPNYECFGYERLMPKLNMANPETADYFCEVGKYWIREFDIDGWRLDVASEVNDGFWRKFHQAVKEVKKDAILIGEVWESAGHWLDEMIYREEIPHLIVGTPNFDNHFCWIDIDNRLAGELAAKHLLHQGYQSVAFIGGTEEDKITMHRLDGVLSVLKEHDLIFPKGYVQQGQSECDSGYYMTEQILSQQTKPDAIICANNYIAYGCMNALHDKNVNVPEELGIITFDEHPFSQILRPRLTVVNVDVFELGVQAGRHILQKIKKPVIHIESRVTYPVLIEGKSTRKVV